MAYSSNRLPSRFPVGTKFVIESHRGREGQVYSRFLEFPDGTFLSLPNRKSPNLSRCLPRNLPHDLASKSVGEARLRRTARNRRPQAAGQ